MLQAAVRNICGYLQDTFQILMSQLQDDKADMEVNASSPPSAPRRKKSRKMSRAEKKQTKLALKAVGKTDHSPVAFRISSDSTHSFDFYKTTDVHNLSDISSIDTPRPSVDLTSSPKPLESPKQSTTDTPRPESIIDKQFSFLNHTSSGNPDQTSELNVGKSQKQRKVGQNMSRHQHQKKSVKADTLLKKLEGSLMMHGKGNGVILEDDEDDDEDVMISPLMEHSSEVSVHTGVVKTHEQLDREGQIVTPQYSQYSLPTSIKKRASILTDVSYERSTMPLTGKSPSKSKIQLSENDGEFSENSSSLDNENGHNKGDSKEEPDSTEHNGDTASNDDGHVTPPKVTYPPPIIDASLPDLETEITTPPPFYKPPPAESVAAEPAASRSSVVTPPTTPSVFKPSTVAETLPVAEQPPTVEEPSPPPKKQRSPWPSMYPYV